MCNKKILSLILALFFIDASVVFTGADSENEKNENIYDEMFLDVQSKITSNTLTLYPTDDAYISTQFGTSGIKTGNQQHIMVENFKNIWSIPYVSWGVINFNLSQIPVSSRRDITSAVLRLYKHNTVVWDGNQSAKLRVNLHEIKRGPWQEEDVKCTGQLTLPNYERDPFSYCIMQRGINDNGWKEWNVTSSVKNWGGRYGWAIVISSYHLPMPAQTEGRVNSLAFYSKDLTQYIPELVVTFNGESLELYVKINQPENMWVYRNSQKWFKVLSSFDLPIAFLFGGRLRIQADAGAPSGINRVEFKIGDWFTRNLQEYIDYSAPYEWNWNDPRFGPNIYELNVTAYDNTGNLASDGLLMIRFR